MSEPSKKSPFLPPRWFIRLFWAVQRAAYSVTGGRFGLRIATADRWGMLRLRTVGRRSGAGSHWSSTARDPLSETYQAIDHVGAGHARGKVAITV